MVDRDLAIATRGLVRDYGRVRALAGLDLEVSRGEVYGLLGNNGAGKTTTLHLLLGLLAPTAGEVSVLGLSPQRDRVALQQRTGFFPESDRPYDWLRVEELMRVGELTFSRWDRGHAEQLRQSFALPPRQQIRELSKGMVAKAKLLLAFGHRPELLALDEPTSGLDPSSRYDLLTVLGEVTRGSDATVLFSSHNLDDVERVATRIGIIDGGRMALTLSREDLRRMSILRFAHPPASPPPSGEAWSRTTGAGCEWLVRDLEHPGLAPALVEAASAGHRVDVGRPTLADVFVFVAARPSSTAGAAA
jgi:ABC-2 type transport system ATP-binding protein